MKKFFKIFLILFLFLLFLPDCINAQTLVLPSQSSQYRSYEYVIDYYDIKMVVNENNTFDITETITAYFRVPKHGIYRKIPLKNTISRLDGTSSVNRAKISEIEVDHEYSTYMEDNNYVIKIGSEEKTLVGTQKYKIHYHYNIGKDPLKEKDELYYNLIGNEWDTVIGNITFTIIMPKDFDATKLGFSSGAIGSIQNDQINYSIKENTITGSYQSILGVGEGITVRVELPEDYFIHDGFTHKKIEYLIYLIPILFLGLSFFLWYRFGRDDSVVETVEFYPPSGFNSLEVGFLYKGKAESRDVTSLLIYLANQGYLKITETNQKGIFSKKSSFKITKLKEYDGNNENEKIFLDGLFSKKKKKSLSNTEGDIPLPVVTESDLYNHFYQTMNKIIANTNKKENRNKIFEKRASSKSIWILLMIMMTYCVITIPPMIEYSVLGEIIIALLFPGIGFTTAFLFIFGERRTIYINGIPNSSAILTKLFGLFIGIMFGGIEWLQVVYPILELDIFYFIGYLWGLVCVIGMVICYSYLPKRTPYGNEILGKLKGFKNFLETAEKEKLEALVEQEPTYFYNILPYAYVLDVSDKWIKKFESISLEAPYWYDSPNSFDITTFHSFMNDTMASAQSSMSSSPSSSSSSGGGFSGGGSGGGGGGSW